jgi:hypothetical protein
MATKLKRRQYEEDSSGGMTVAFEAEEKLAHKARAAVANMRQDILRGDNVAPWVTQLVEDLDRHTDMSMVAVGWLLKEKGVLK